VEPFQASGRLRGMWRSVLLGMVMAVAATGCDNGTGLTGLSSGS
jgi:hypothetical protein